MGTFRARKRLLVAALTLRPDGCKTGLFLETHPDTGGSWWSRLCRSQLKPAACNSGKFMSTIRLTRVKLEVTILQAPVEVSVR